MAFDVEGVRKAALPIVAIAVLMVLPGAVPVEAAFPCNSSKVSGPQTLWTGYDPLAPGFPGTSALGVMAPTVTATPPSIPSWKPIPAGVGGTPGFRWAPGDSPFGPASPTATSLVFTEPAFSPCGGVERGQLWINGDVSYEAYFNGVLVATCGLPVSALLPGDLHSICYTSYQVVNILLLPAPAVNQLVVLARNNALTLPASVHADNPGMIQYRIDY